MSKLTVRQGNDLIDASYKIASIGEARLVRLLIAQIQPWDEDFKTYQISIADFIRVFNLSKDDGRIYEVVEKAAEDLMRRIVTIRNGKSWYKTPWLSAAKYLHGSGMVELRFDKDLKPHLLQLQGYYTEYDLEHTVHFKSLYSIRLFELLKREYRANGKTRRFSRSFEYEELREKMGIEKNEYGLFAHFRTRVIEPATKEINRFSSLNVVQVDYAKTGRKVTRIVFHYEPQKQVPIVLEDTSPVVEEQTQDQAPEDVRELVAMGINEATAYRWRKKYGVERIERNIKYTREMEKDGKIKNISGYLARAIADDMGSGWEDGHKKKTEEKKRIAEMQEQAQREEKDKAEARRKERESLLAAFHVLPESEQDAARAAFVASDTFKPLARFWNKAKADGNGKPETLPMIKAIFCDFYSAYKSIE